ncbi:hypothetical protein ACFQV2_33890 [Actinokineospora soli]|uniref:Uncharacterized protein n=1 Tax=Actinokineospora soli TaxID=1048753 RepID=A0ABW2TWE4_9PSEU
MTAQGDLAAAGNFSTPKCAVPRNVPNRVAYGATARQAAWAVDLASLNAIQGAHARPANHRQTGLPAYSPSLDFPVPALAAAAAGSRRSS